MALSIAQEESFHLGLVEITDWQIRLLQANCTDLPCSVLRQEQTDALANKEIYHGFVSKAIIFSIYKVWFSEASLRKFLKMAYCLWVAKNHYLQFSGPLNN